MKEEWQWEGEGHEGGVTMGTGRGGARRSGDGNRRGGAQRTSDDRNRRRGA